MSKDKPMPLSKSLRFDEDRNEVFEIPNLDSMPDEEIASTWYESREYTEIKSAYQLTIFMMEAGEVLNSEEHTSRGLEYRTQEGAWARYENKRDAYNAVLDEQDRQWQSDKDDHDEISRIYLLHSTKCAEAARGRARQDEADAMEFLRSIMPKKRLAKMKMVEKGEKKPSEKSKRRGAAKGIDKAQEMLRERSSIRRSEILDDIQRLKDEVKKTTRAPPHRTMSV